jgi:hypothetical protein
VRQREVSREHISVGLIGCGHAAEMHLAAIRSSGRARVVAAADIDKTAVQRVAREGIRAFSDYHGVLAAPEVDTVAVLTPPHVQFEIASAALIAGKHVLIERPMTRSLAEADGSPSKPAALEPLSWPVITCGSIATYRRRAASSKPARWERSVF